MIRQQPSCASRALVRVMRFLRVGPRSAPNPFADLLCYLAPPFGPDADLLQLFLAPSNASPVQMSSPCPSTISPDISFPRQALLFHTCHGPREHCPSSAHRRLNVLGVCLDKRVRVE